MRKLLAGLALITVSMMSSATEEPGYELIEQIDKFEIRQYAPYIVAEVLVEGPADKAGGQAFPILAGYIFGENKGEHKFAMTAPVTQTNVPIQMPMTAPVTQAAAPGGYLVRFVLPKGVTLASAPEPTNARVHLREVAASRVAVIVFSGFWSDANYQENLSKLQALLRGKELTWVGEPIYARYNPPFTPWFMRRNEIWLNLAQH